MNDFEKLTERNRVLEADLREAKEKIHDLRGEANHHLDNHLHAVRMLEKANRRIEELERPVRMRPGSVKNCMHCGWIPSFVRRQSGRDWYWEPRCNCDTLRGDGRTFIEDAVIDWNLCGFDAADGSPKQEPAQPETDPHCEWCKDRECEDRTDAPLDWDGSPERHHQDGIHWECWEPEKANEPQPSAWSKLTAEMAEMRRRLEALEAK